MILPLIYYGGSGLRKKCDPVEEINQEILQLAADMKETMIALGNAVGLAAPQVGRNVRLFAVGVSGEFDVEGYPIMLRDPEILINPILSNPSEELEGDSEGCVSIPGIYATVYRPQSIDVEWTDLQGNRQKRREEGYRARVVMHENDHINGVLFIDRLTAKERKAQQKALNEVRKKYHRKGK